MKTARFTCLALAMLATLTGTRESAYGQPSNERGLFEALHFSFSRTSRASGVSLGAFSPDGPIVETLTPVSRRLCAVLRDPETDILYGLTTHDFGTIDARGKLVEIPPPSSGKISWPKGLALSVPDRELWVSSGKYLHVHDLRDRSWRKIELGDMRLGVIAYSENERRLYGIPDAPSGAAVVRELVEINSKGAVVKHLELSRPIPIGQGSETHVQMASEGGLAFVLVSRAKPPPRLTHHGIYRIELSSGETVLFPYDQEGNPVEKLWPGMPPGPEAFEGPSDGCLEGSASSYVTPANLTRGEREELHVISVYGGDGNALRQARLRGGTEKPENESASGHAPVDVRVEVSNRPIALCLVSAEAVEWRIHASRRAGIARIVLLGGKGSVVIGAPSESDLEDRTANDAFSSRRHAVTSWELEENMTGNFDRLIRDVRRLTELRESSFQACRSGRRFVVPPR